MTTPWSTYSFHPIEALMLGNIILLPMLVHDFYFWSLASVPVLSLILNLIGHSNYDFSPRSPTRTRWLPAAVTICTTHAPPATMALLWPSWTRSWERGSRTALPKALVAE